jgi:DHA1 family bicyclomycin/chloramphenicol resistance-like MFS transporter
MPTDSAGDVAPLDEGVKRNAFFDGQGCVLLLGALTALDPLSIDMYLPAFDDIGTSFRTSTARVELSVSTFFVGMALGQLFYGPLADRFGRRRPLVGGMLVYLLATLGCAFAPGIHSFIAFRFLQALGGCAGLVVVRAVVRDRFEKQRAASFLSNMALVMGVAPILAPSVGSMINGIFGWRAIFIVLALANVTCMVSVVAFLPETGRRGGKPLRLSSVVESYVALLRDRKFVGYLIPDTAIRAGMFAYIAGSPFVFINLFHIPPGRYALLFGLNGCGLMLGSQVNRRLLRFFTADAILSWSVKVAAAAAALVFAWTWAGLPHAIVLFSIFVFIATLNFVSPNSVASALASQGHQAGTASALYGCLQWSMATVSSFLVSSLHDGTALPMTGVMLVCGIVSLAAFQLLVVAKVGPTRA